MKRSKRLIRDFIATGCAAALALGGAAPAFAFNNQAYKAPTKETPVVDTDGYRFATAVGQHGSAVLGEYAGLSEQVNEIFATPGNGINTSDYMYNPYLGIFGTDANEVPDPYTANLFYNWYVEAQSATAGAAALQKSDNAMVNMLFTASKGSSIVSDNSFNEKTGTSYTLSGRPDVLTINPTAVNQFQAQIDAINNESKDSKYYRAASATYVGDDKYQPVNATYDESNMRTQVANMWRQAKAAEKVVADNTAAGVKVKTRYGDSLETAQKYELYTKGSILYTLSKIADGTVKEKTIAYVKGISGNDANATVTLYSEPNPSVSREMAHHIECTVPTAKNLANVLNPSLTRDEKMQEVTCTVADLAKADVIILADPDNMAYNLRGQDEKGLFVKPSWVKSDDYGTAENNWGQAATRSATDESGKAYYKNRFWGPQPSTTKMVDQIKAALTAEGSAGAKALAEKTVLSCVQEGSSSSDGGSIEAMSQYGIINAFVYPEIASGVNQYAWWLDNISHIKTDRVAEMVKILCQDMSLADGAKLADVDGWNASKSDVITKTYEEGLAYYAANKASVDKDYPWLAPTNDLVASNSALASVANEQLANAIEAAKKDVDATQLTAKQKAAFETALATAEAAKDATGTEAVKALQTLNDAVTEASDAAAANKRLASTIASAEKTDTSKLTANQKDALAKAITAAKAAAAEDAETADKAAAAASTLSRALAVAENANGIQEVIAAAQAFDTSKLDADQKAALAKAIADAQAASKADDVTVEAATAAKSALNKAIAAAQEASDAAKTQKITAKNISKTYKVKKVKKKAQTIKIGAKAKTSVTYKFAKLTGKNKKALKVDAKKGTVTVKKGTTKGTYKAKVTISAAAGKGYAPATKTITVTAKVTK